MHKWSTLQERPIYESHPLKLTSITNHTHRVTHMHVHFSYQNTHTSPPWSVCLRLSPLALRGMGGGRGREAVAVNIPSLTCFLVAPQPQCFVFVMSDIFLVWRHRVFSALNAVKTCWCRQRLTFNLNLQLLFFKCSLNIYVSAIKSDPQEMKIRLQQVD